MRKKEKNLELAHNRYENRERSVAGWTPSPPLPSHGGTRLLASDLGWAGARLPSPKALMEPHRVFPIPNASRFAAGRAVFPGSSSLAR